MMNLTTDIILITYIGGTGGHFLSYFLSKARDNDFEKVTLSENGNAHHNKMDIGIPYTFVDPDKLKFEYIVNYNIPPSIKKPYFCHGHIKDVEQCISKFKTIRITYDSDDILDLSYTHLTKNNIDMFNMDRSLWDEQIVNRKFFLHGNIRYFKNKSEQNLLPIRWKELYYGDTKILMKKLSDFTDIPVSNFNISNLYQWREKTRLGIDKIKQLLTK